VIDHGQVIAEGIGNELKDRVGGQILEVLSPAGAGRARGDRGDRSESPRMVARLIVGILAVFVLLSVWRYRRMS
jgi:hypothetical protein